MTYFAYSDGACKGNPGPGGWGSIVDCPNGVRIEVNGGELNTTNNKMELQGAITALQNTPPGSTVSLTTDSQYVIKGVTEWMTGWKRRGWQTSTGESVKNQELWKQLDIEVSRRKVDFKWVRGHTGHPENERCDELANSAITVLPGAAEIIAANAAKPKASAGKKSTEARPKPVDGTSNMLKRKNTQDAIKPNSAWTFDGSNNKVNTENKGPVIGDSEMTFEL